jgi:transposase
MYDPKDLLKLYVYGYMNRVRSSRRLETETKRNVEVIWLLGKLSPDHKAIANFRHENIVIYRARRAHAAQRRFTKNKYYVLSIVPLILC